MKKDQEAAIQSHPSHAANLQFEAMFFLTIGVMIYISFFG